MPKVSKINILAIETSADETSAAVLKGDLGTKKFKLLSNIIYSQIRQHQKTGGIVPEVAARAHIPKILPAVKLALQESQTKLSEIDCFAVTIGPGLITSLMIGVDTAKALAFALDKPIIPINHLEGHLLSALNTKNSKYCFPALGLIVSGGHTMLVLVKDFGGYQILGQTLDDAAGECFDKVAKLLSLSYPGGPALSQLAKSGQPVINFPRPMIDQNNFNFSFAGLKTSVLYYLQNRPSPSPLPWRGERREERSPALKTKKVAQLIADIAASVEQAIVDVLVEKTIRAAKQYQVKTVLLGGGVAANEKLRKTLQKRIASETNSQLLAPNSKLTTDNAGMIAQAAFWHNIYGDKTWFNKVRSDPNLELKSWRK